MPLLVIAILIITNGILTWIVAGSILNPLYQLKAAANRIKEGDLNTPLKYGGQDEFQDLTNSFEEMRVRLLGSLNEQMKADENRKELLSNISHDLKTPITTIKGYAEGIRDGIADSPDKVSKYMDTIYRKSILMDEMIDSLLLYSRLDLNKVLFNFRDVDLTHFLKDICDDMQFDYPELEIEFTREAPVFVVADLTNLHRVISNLIDNAVKYRSEQSPVVRISIEEQKQDVTVRIKDNGRGIADEDIPHIFDRFYRADKARSSEIKGSGLGLAISKQIIESHGGRISAVRSAEGGIEIVFNLRRSK
jgi:histidine kinase